MCARAQKKAIAAAASAQTDELVHDIHRAVSALQDSYFLGSLGDLARKQSPKLAADFHAHLHPTPFPQKLRMPTAVSQRSHSSAVEYTQRSERLRSEYGASEGERERGRTGGVEVAGEASWRTDATPMSRVLVTAGSKRLSVFD